MSQLYFSIYNPKGIHHACELNNNISRSIYRAIFNKAIKIQNGQNLSQLQNSQVGTIKQISVNIQISQGVKIHKSILKFRKAIKQGDSLYV